MQQGKVNISGSLLLIIAAKEETVQEQIILVLPLSY